MQHADFDRRVYRREFESLLGCGSTWFRKLISRGTVPHGLRDPGGRREWWPASQVQTILERMRKQAEPATSVKPVGARTKQRATRAAVQR
jgi:hypothetical protein